MCLYCSFFLFKGEVLMNNFGLVRGLAQLSGGRVARRPGGSNGSVLIQCYYFFCSESVQLVYLATATVLIIFFRKVSELYSRYVI